MVLLFISLGVSLIKETGKYHILLDSCWIYASVDDFIRFCDHLNNFNS